MQSVDAVDGGKMSAHRYARDFPYVDSGIASCPPLLKLMSKTGKRFSELVGEHFARFPTSGKINCEASAARATIDMLQDRLSPQAFSMDDTDGCSFAFAHRRLNLRMSTIEPVVRPNVESRGDPELTRAKMNEVLPAVDG